MQFAIGHPAPAEPEVVLVSDSYLPGQVVGKFRKDAGKKATIRKEYALQIIASFEGIPVVQAGYVSRHPYAHLNLVRGQFVHVGPWIRRGGHGVLGRRQVFHNFKVGLQPGHGITPRNPIASRFLKYLFSVGFNALDYGSAKNAVAVFATAETCAQKYVFGNTATGAFNGILWYDSLFAALAVIHHLTRLGVKNMDSRFTLAGGTNHVRLFYPLSHTSPGIHRSPSNRQERPLFQAGRSPLCNLLYMIEKTFNVSGSNRAGLNAAGFPDQEKGSR